MLANQGFLDFAGTRGIDLLLSALATALALLRDFLLLVEVWSDVDTVRNFAVETWLVRPKSIWRLGLRRSRATQPEAQRTPALNHFTGMELPSLKSGPEVSFPTVDYSAYS